MKSKKRKNHKANKLPIIVGSLFILLAIFIGFKSGLNPLSYFSQPPSVNKVVDDAGFAFTTGATDETVTQQRSRDRDLQDQAIIERIAQNRAAAANRTTTTPSGFTCDSSGKNLVSKETNTDGKPKTIICLAGCSNNTCNLVTGSGSCGTLGAPVSEGTWVSTGAGANCNETRTSCTDVSCVQCTANGYTTTKANCKDLVATGQPIVLPPDPSNLYTGTGLPSGIQVDGQTQNIWPCFAGGQQFGIGATNPTDKGSICSTNGKWESTTAYNTTMKKYCAAAGSSFEDGHSSCSTAAASTSNVTPPTAQQLYDMLDACNSLRKANPSKEYNFIAGTGACVEVVTSKCAVDNKGSLQANGSWRKCTASGNYVYTYCYNAKFDSNGNCPTSPSTPSNPTASEAEKTCHIQHPGYTYTTDGKCLPPAAVTPAQKTSLYNDCLTKAKSTNKAGSKTWISCNQTSSRPESSSTCNTTKGFDAGGKCQQDTPTTGNGSPTQPTTVTAKNAGQVCGTGTLSYGCNDTCGGVYITVHITENAAKSYDQNFCGTEKDLPKLADPYTVVKTVVPTSNDSTGVDTGSVDNTDISNQDGGQRVSDPSKCPPGVTKATYVGGGFGGTYLCYNSDGSPFDLNQAAQEAPNDNVDTPTASAPFQAPASVQWGAGAASICTIGMLALAPVTVGTTLIGAAGCALFGVGTGLIAYSAELPQETTPTTTQSTSIIDNSQNTPPGQPCSNWLWNAVPYGNKCSSGKCVTSTDEQMRGSYCADNSEKIPSNAPTYTYLDAGSTTADKSQCKYAQPQSDGTFKCLSEAEGEAILGN